MELYAAVQPLVMTLEQYEQVFGEDDPEEVALLQMQDRDLARQITGVIQDLYFVEIALDVPQEGEGLAEEIGTVEEFTELRVLAAATMGKTVDDYHEGRVAPGFLYNHLINHDEESGYYLPVDFPQSFFVEELSVGSSVALLKELEKLEPVLAAAFPDQVAVAITTESHEERAPLTGPVGVWHSLLRLCRSSIEMNMPIHLG